MTTVLFWRQPFSAFRRCRGLFNHGVFALLFEERRFTKRQAILLGARHGPTGHMGKLQPVRWS